MIAVGHHEIDVILQQGVLGAGDRHAAVGQLGNADVGKVLRDVRDRQRGIVGRRDGQRRLTFVAELTGRLNDRAQICKPYGYLPNDAPFVYPIIVDTTRITCSKEHFARAILAEGIGLNPHYHYLVSDWPWLKSYLPYDFATPNARVMRDRSFILYLNENYGNSEAADCTKAIVKIENYFRR